ncbi:hypothetical protein B0H14DRAFT_2642284 [Mycena olivaceomarginata]|nr:hypothetical protein B0H14DRAFT_2642284 [Mycena olivaceomarginata]
MPLRHLTVKPTALFDCGPYFRDPAFRVVTHLHLLRKPDHGRPRPEPLRPLRQEQTGGVEEGVYIHPAPDALCIQQPELAGARLPGAARVPSTRMLRPSFALDAQADWQYGVTGAEDMWACAENSDSRAPRRTNACSKILALRHSSLSPLDNILYTLFELLWHNALRAVANANSSLPGAMREHSSLLPPPPSSPATFLTRPQPSEWLSAGKTAPRARSSNHTSLRAGSGHPHQRSTPSTSNVSIFEPPKEHIPRATASLVHFPSSPLHIPHSTHNQQTRQSQNHFEGGGDPNGSSDDELSDAPESNNMYARAAAPFNKDVLCPLQTSSSGFFNYPIAGV